MPALAVGTGRSGVVSLQVRADVWYLPFIRMLATDIAARVGLDEQKVNDARIVVTEIASALFDTPAEGALAQLDFEISPVVLRIIGRVSLQRSAYLQQDAISLRLLRELAEAVTAVDVIDPDGSHTMRMSAQVRA